MRSDHGQAVSNKGSAPLDRRRRRRHHRPPMPRGRQHLGSSGMSVARLRVRPRTGSIRDEGLGALPMTTLPNRPRTALIVIDVQKGVVNGAPKRDDVVANINTLVSQARAQHVPVIWVQHNDDEGLPRGSAEWDLAPELVRDDS